MKLFKKLSMCLCVSSTFFVYSQAANAQTQADTLQLSLPQTEALFLQKNLQLLAQHFNVKADSALIQQAKLWDNPTFIVDQNVYANKQFFQHGADAAGNPTGQYYLQIQQLIQLGGKRHKAIDVARTSAGITQLQFEELLNNLRLRLRIDFYTILQLQRFGKLYQQELDEISKLVLGMEAQLKAGNIARKDLLRVQAVEIGLQQEQVENAKSSEESENDLRTLLNYSGNEFIQPDLEKLSAIPALPKEGIEELTRLARLHNATYQIAAQQLQFQKLTTRYQKSLAIPDLNVGPNFDRASNFTPNYFGLTLGIPLPLFNRNQGNIHAAEFNVKQQENLFQLADVNLQNEVRSAYRKLALTLSIAGPKSTNFYNEYRQLFENIIQSYKNRQISLVEFIDYLNGYEDIREKQLQQQLSIQTAKEELNYTIGIDVVQ